MSEVLPVHTRVLPGLGCYWERSALPSQRDTAALGCCSAHQGDLLFGHRDPLASLSTGREVLPPAPTPTALLLVAGSCVELWPLRPAGRTPEGGRLGTQRSKEGQPATSSLPALVRLAHSAAINNPCSLLPNTVTQLLGRSCPVPRHWQPPGPRPLCLTQLSMATGLPAWASSHCGQSCFSAGEEAASLGLNTRWFSAAPADHLSGLKRPQT